MTSRSHNPSFFAAPELSTMGALGPGTRERALRSLADQVFDLVIIGGGPVGCGAALDAAARGWSVALVERADLGSGSSHRASYFTHGGLLHLEQFHWGLSRECVRERALLHQLIAPHLAQPASLLFPLQRDAGHRWSGNSDEAASSANYGGINLADVLGTGTTSLPGHRHLSHFAARALAPGLAETGLLGGIHFEDHQIDHARLTVALARTAAEHGAVIATGAPVVALLQRQGRIAGAVIVDEETEELINVRARAVLSCAGAATQEIYRLSGASQPAPLTVESKRAVHLILSRRAVDSQVGLAIQTDQAPVFLIPWHQHWLLGTHRATWRPGKHATHAATMEDVETLLAQLNRALDRPVATRDVLGAYAGLRPVVSQSRARQLASSGLGVAFGVRRDYQVVELVPGLTAIAGGTWMGYRPMAENAVSMAMRSVVSGRLPRSTTTRIELSGARGSATAQHDIPRIAVEVGVDQELGEQVARRYGGHAYQVLELVRQQPDLAMTIADEPLFIAAEVMYACRFEGALHLEDVLDRRLRLALMGPPSEATRLDVAAHMATALGWDNTRTSAELAAYDTSVGLGSGGGQHTLTTTSAAS